MRARGRVAHAGAGAGGTHAPASAGAPPRGGTDVAGGTARKRWHLRHAAGRMWTGTGGGVSRRRGRKRAAHAMRAARPAGACSDMGGCGIPERFARCAARGGGRGPRRGRRPQRGGRGGAKMRFAASTRRRRQAAHAAASRKRGAAGSAVRRKTPDRCKKSDL